MMPAYRSHAAMLLIAGTLASCAGPEGAGPIKGVVVDLATGKPIAGAVVRVVREGTGGGLANTQTVCISLQTALTDQNGAYEVGRVSAGNHKDIVQDIRVFKSGYVLPGGFHAFYPQSSTYVVLERFEGPREKWISYVLSAGNPVCGEKQGRWDDSNSLNWLIAIRSELVGTVEATLSDRDGSSFRGIEREYEWLTKKGAAK